MNKPTVHDIAREAGVSLATVDRVLNDRPGVRARTIDRVHDAVKRLGYVRDTYAANLARQRQYRFAFLLPEGPSQFTTTLKGAIREVYASQILDRVQLRMISVPSHDPHAVVRALHSLNADKLDGVAIMAPESPQVRDAVARIKSEGLVVVAVVSDLPNSPRDHFIGINNIAAGRTAGLLMGRMVRDSGEVLVVTNSMMSRDSIERRLGFDAVTGEEFPHLKVLPSVEAYDDPSRMREIVAEVVTSRPQVLGVYSMGFGNTPALSALRDSGRIRDLVVIAHELTPSTREGLLKNEISAVIAQNVGHLVRSAMRVLRALSDGQPIVLSQEKIRLDVILRENLP